MTIGLYGVAGAQRIVIPKVGLGLFAEVWRDSSGSQDYNSIFEFADFMADEGISPELIEKLMHDNPFAAYSRSENPGG